MATPHKAPPQQPVSGRPGNTAAGVQDRAGRPAALLREERLELELELMVVPAAPPVAIRGDPMVVIRAAPMVAIRVTPTVGMMAGPAATALVPAAQGHPVARAVQVEMIRPAVAEVPAVSEVPAVAEVPEEVATVTESRTSASAQFDLGFSAGMKTRQADPGIHPRSLKERAFPGRLRPDARMCGRLKQAKPGPGGSGPERGTTCGSEATAVLSTAISCSATSQAGGSTWDYDCNPAEGRAGSSDSDEDDFIRGAGDEAAVCYAAGLRFTP